MQNILGIISPLFLAIAVGFLFVHYGLFAKSDIRVLGRFVIQIALPALLFKALAERPFVEILNFDYLLAYGLGSFISLVICAYFAKYIKNIDRQSIGMMVVGSSLSNSGFIGFPLVIQYLGDGATVALALSMLVENLLVFPIAIVVAESANNKHTNKFQLLGSLFLSLLKNPLILAIIFGFLFSLLSINLPHIAVKLIDMFAMASGAVALFVIGGTLVGLKIGGDLPRIIWVSFAKLFIHPLAVIIMFIIFVPADPMLKTAGIIIAALPMFSIFPIIGQKYQQESWCASALLLATVSSFFTLSFVLWLYQ